MRKQDKVQVSTCNVTQQVTASTPANKSAKNPKEVFAGKATAKRTRPVREAQKRKTEEAEAIITAHK